MAQKLLRIEQFTTAELGEFLKKNGCSEFEETIINQEVSGKMFLDLNELQILKWKLALSEKRKLMNFLKELKENPQKFIVQTESVIKDNVGLNRRQSISRQFKEKLELVIGPKPPDQKIGKKPAVLPKPKEENAEKTSSPSDYLQMDGNNVQKSEAEAHYDHDGYLLPVKKDVVEENDYEPSPSDEIVRNFMSTTSSKNMTPFHLRKPLPLPRESTDERGYISGPSNRTIDSAQPPQLISLSSLTQKAPKMNTPSPTTPKSSPKVVVQDDSDSSDSEPTYQPVDYGDDIVPKIASNENLNTETPNTNCEGSTFSKIRNFINKSTKFKTINSEQKNTESTGPQERRRSHEEAVTKTLDTSTPHSQTLGKEFFPTRRPLPPLPHQHKNLNTLQMTSSVPDNLAKNYNTRTVAQAGKIPNNKGKSISESNLVSRENEVAQIYGNVDDDQTTEFKYPGSYELHLPKLKSAKQALPLPPHTLPEIPLDLNADWKTRSDDNDFINLNNNYFFRSTDRKGARLLLFDLEDGAFLFRKSNRFFLTLSLKHNNMFFNLGIEKTDNQTIRLYTEGENTSPEFSSLTDFVSHFTTELLSFQHRDRVIEVYLKPILPPNRF
jgi:hypothetical protein